MMRSQQFEIVTGQISKTAVALKGPLSAVKTGTGVHLVWPPPGKKIVGMSVTAKEEAVNQASVCHVNNIQGDSVRVITYRGSDGALMDVEIMYTATLAPT